MTPFDIVVSPVASKFAKALQRALQEKVINTIYRRLTPKQIPARRTIISRRGNILRHGRAASIRQHFLVTPRVLNKIEQLQVFTEKEISCPKYSTTITGAKELNCKTLFARKLINSTNGRGIVEFKGNEEAYPQAPLYTEYIPKKAEYRFHVFGNKVIDIQEKRKKIGFEDERDTRIRNVHNGYVYCRDGLNIPAGAGNLAVQAVQACNYQYGAVDIIYNEKRNQCYVLEVNSRPGLMGATLEKYAEALINTYNLERK